MSTSAQAVPAAAPDMSPVSIRLATPPARPAAIPIAPMTNPSAAATDTFAVTMIDFDGRAVRAPASVPCCTSEVNSSVPATTANSVVSQLDTRNVLPIVNGRWSYGSSSTMLPRISDMPAPITAARPTKIAVARTDRSLIHSLRTAARRSRPVDDVAVVVTAVGRMWVTVVFMVCPLGWSGWVAGWVGSCACVRQRRSGRRRG